MTPRQTRFAWVVAGLIVLAVISTFVVQALRENMVFFYTPTPARRRVRALCHYR